MTDKTNTTKAQKTDIEGLLGADKVKPLYERGSFWLVLLILLASHPLCRLPTFSSEAVRDKSVLSLSLSPKGI